MKKKTKISLILSIFLCMIFMFFTQIPESNAQAQINYASYDFINIEGTDINATITANVGILTDGGIALWSIEPTFTTNLTISAVIIRGIINGSIYQRGLTFPSTFELNDDTELIGFPGPSNKTFSEFVPTMKENLLLLPDIYGIPNSFSFNISVFIATPTTNQTLHLSTVDSPLVTIIFRNPDALPELSSVFFGLMYGLPFLMPISVILVFTISKKIKEKKAKKSGGNKGAP